MKEIEFTKLKYEQIPTTIGVINRTGIIYCISDDKKINIINLNFRGNLISASITDGENKTNRKINAISTHDLEMGEERDINLLKKIYNSFITLERNEFLQILVSLNTNSMAYRVACDVIGQENIIDSVRTRKLER